MAKTKTKLLSATNSLSNNSLLSLGMIVCTVVVVLGFLASRKLISDIHFNNKVISNKNAVKATLDANVKNLPDLTNNFNQLQTSGPKPSAVLAALPLDAGYQRLADQFETMAALAHARLASIALSSDPSAGTQPTVTSGVGEVQFQVTAVGSYASLRALAHNIEISARPIKIVSVKLTGSEPSVTGDFTLVTYYQPKTDPNPQTEVLQ